METAHTNFKKILAIDIGQGTQDILVYDADINIENCISLILPSPTTRYARLIEACTQDLYLYGSTIGGGRISGAITNHIKKGFSVYMEPEAAASIRDNPDQVRKLGITLGRPPDTADTLNIELTEVNVALLKQFLASFSEDLDAEVLAVAVQDHGTSPEGKSDRMFRFEVMAQRLMADTAPESFAYWADEVPAFFTRMTSLVKSARREFNGRILVMDTALCAVLGCVDERPDPHLIVNAGNDHIVCVIVANRKIEAFMEHHTGMLTAEKLRAYILKFASGELTSQEVYDDWGHGALYINRAAVRLDTIIVTGPNRENVRQTGLPVSFAAPGGNMMLTGPIGLVKACQYKSR